MSAFFRQGAFQFPRFLRTPILVTSLLSCILTLLTLVFVPRLQPTVPLFYTLADVNDFLVPKMWLFVFPALSILITVTHLWLLRVLHSHDRLIVQVFCWQTVIIQSLLLISLIRILLLVT